MPAESEKQQRISNAEYLRACEQLSIVAEPVLQNAEKAKAKKYLLSEKNNIVTLAYLSQATSQKSIRLSLLLSSFENALLKLKSELLKKNIIQVKQIRALRHGEKAVRREDRERLFKLLIDLVDVDGSNQLHWSRVYQADWQSLAKADEEMNMGQEVATEKVEKRKLSLLTFLVGECAKFSVAIAKESVDLIPGDDLDLRQPLTPGFARLGAKFLQYLPELQTATPQQQLCLIENYLHSKLSDLRVHNNFLELLNEIIEALELPNVGRLQFNEGLLAAHEKTLRHVKNDDFSMSDVLAANSHTEGRAPPLSTSPSNR